MKRASQAGLRRAAFQKRHAVVFGPGLLPFSKTTPCRFSISCSASPHLRARSSRADHAGRNGSPRSRLLPSEPVGRAHATPVCLCSVAAGEAPLFKNDTVSFLVSHFKKCYGRRSPIRARFQKRHGVVFGYLHSATASMIPPAGSRQQKRHGVVFGPETRA